MEWKLADGPTLLWADDRRRGRLVVACCRHAAMMGVQIAMPLVQAKQLLLHDPNRPDANVLPHDPFADQTLLMRLATDLQSALSPKVAIETLAEHPWAGFPRHQPESLFCDITGVEHLFGGESSLIDAARTRMNEHYAINLHARIAAAPNIATAWALAHFGDHAIEVTEDPETALRPLPVESLRLMPATVGTLGRLGIETVNQLLRLPRGGLATRLGKPLVTRISQALGELEEPITVHHDDAELSCSDTLEYPTSDLGILLDRIERLLEEIRVGLVTRKHGALGLRCHLSLVTPPPLELQIGLFAPSQDTKHLLSLLESRLETQSLPSDVVRLTISIPLSAPIRSVQAGLFEQESVGGLDRGADSPQSFGGSVLSRMVDSLSGRLGRESVLKVRMEQDSVPENSYVAYPMTGPSPSRSRAKRAKQVGRGNSENRASRDDGQHLPSRHDAMRRPLTVFDRPYPLLSLKTSTPPLGDVPALVRYRGQAYRVIRCWGPERMETGWWNGPTIRRDYYRVETESGQWWWIYRDMKATQSDPNKPKWMLHGLFA
ncbi:DNA polymerase IV [Novipirellula artificiosorum]|uniref:DNA polymerase IV n=2 Tax=Novipirellula artificiosorum TaxID=2528016 RepID=A0A5C6DGH6_9BACT|nr:DNA polymerase IV [Novipirellula artificiosorum]